MFKITDQGLVFCLVCNQCGKESLPIEKAEIDRAAAQLRQEINEIHSDQEAPTADGQADIDNLVNLCAAEMVLIDQGWFSNFVEDNGCVGRVSLCPEHAKRFLQADLN